MAKHTTVRIIGDVHGQVDSDNLFTPGAKPYLEIVASASYSIQIGDMGDGETYDQLTQHVDARRHRFIPGNHDHYDRLPPHSLGDFGTASLGGVDFFFVRGAASNDRDKLVRLGRELGTKLWFEQEELTDDQMSAAERDYLLAQPRVVLSHEAPTHISQFSWRHASQARPSNPGAIFRQSRTTAFLARLFEQHQPRIWVFGHHHRDWSYREGKTLFVCVGELSHIEVDSDGNVIRPPGFPGE